MRWVMMNLQEYVNESLSATPPLPCDFCVGDEVIFTNKYGNKFDAKVIGFSSGWLLKYGQFVHIAIGESGDAYWYPHNPNSLKAA